SGKPYKTCFRSYPSHQAGAADLIRTMVRGGVGRALRSGSAVKIADAMHANRYFERAPEAYAARIDARARAIAAEIGEPLFVQMRPPLGWFPIFVTLGAAAYLFVERRHVARALGPAYMSLRGQLARFGPCLGGK